MFVGALAALITHMGLSHGHDYGFNVQCAIDGCPASYRIHNSFAKHVRRVHRGALEEPPAPGPDAANGPNQVGIPTFEVR